MDEVDEFCASTKRATEAVKEFNTALRSIPLMFRILWYVRDWLLLFKSSDYDVLPKPAHFAQPDVIALPTAAPRTFYSHAD